MSTSAVFGTDVLRMAVDTALRDINEATAFDGSRRGGNGCGGLYSVDDKSNE